MNKRILFLIFFTFYGIRLCAQNTQLISKPTAILFILHISTNKIESLQKKGLKEDAKDVIQADYEINSSIVRDFEKYFDYCPVYFFYDTQMNFVIKRQWESVEFYDYEHYKTNKKIEISNIDGYFIAEVNYPPVTEYPTVDAQGKVHEPEYTTDYAIARDYGILCYDEDFKLLRNKLQYINISLRRTGNMFKPETLLYKFTGAAKFQEKLEKYCGKKS